MPETPDQTLLTRIFDTFAHEEYPELPEDDAFERFTLTQMLKPLELTQNQLEAAIVDGTQDGGIDSFLVFVNGVFMEVDDPILDPASEANALLARHPQVEVWVIQSKNSKSWKESVWEKLLSTLPNVLDLNRTEAELATIYNSDVVEQTGILRTLQNAFAGKFPQINFHLRYVTRATEANLTETIAARARQVRDVVASCLPNNASVTEEHLGAEKLYAKASESFGKPATLTFRELLREIDSYVGVATLSEYLKFVRDDAGTLREELFDSNVRDFEGDNIVNKAISETLSTDDGIEFWWLNNGVTVLGDEVDGPQKTLTISRPLVVNGLQTSHVLHRAAIEGTIEEERLTNGIVVRVIASVNETVRDRIIAGTNRQTPVPGPALYATDPFQIRLEEFLAAKGFFYERRKNRYKNQGKPANKRISMGLLAQVAITTLLGQPDQARARPSSIMTRKGGYRSVFPDGIDLNVYVRALRLVEKVDTFLATPRAKDILDEPSNTRFFLLAGAVMYHARARNWSRTNFGINSSAFNSAATDSDLEVVLAVLKRMAARYQKEHPEMSRDSVFKSAEFRDKFLAAVGRAVGRQAAAKKSTSGTK